MLLFWKRAVVGLLRTRHRIKVTRKWLNRAIHDGKHHQLKVLEESIARLLEHKKARPWPVPSLESWPNTSGNYQK